MQPDPDYPSVQECQQAQAATLRERARILDEVGPAGEAGVLRTFRSPSLQDLQREEDCLVDAAAEFLARQIFGHSTRDRLTPRIAADLEQGCRYAVRRVHPEWMLAAQQQAAETIANNAEEFGPTFRHLSPAERRIVAWRLVQTMFAGFHAVLEGRVSIKPATALRIAAAATERGAR
jgi:hypothetical protein